jgi:hypothetical protein
VLVCQRLRCSSAQSVGSFVSFSDQEASIPHSRTMAGTASSFARTKTGSARRRGFGLVQRESGDQAGRRSTTAGTYPHWSVVTATDGIGINPGSYSKAARCNARAAFELCGAAYSGVSSKLASTCPITSARISRPSAALRSLVRRPQRFSVRPFPALHRRSRPANCRRSPR